MSVQRSLKLTLGLALIIVLVGGIDGLSKWLGVIVGLLLGIVSLPKRGQSGSTGRELEREVAAAHPEVHRSLALSPDPRTRAEAVKRAAMDHQLRPRLEELREDPSCKVRRLARRRLRRAS
jgi:hypothetical protein